MHPITIAIAFIVLFQILKTVWEHTVGKSSNRRQNRFGQFVDRFKTLDEVQEGLRQAGLESSNLIIGIDFTQSNEFQGRRTFGGRSLHTVLPDLQNPYQRVIAAIGRTLETFDEDGYIPAFGFGDATTRGHAVFPFVPDPGSQRFCKGVQEVLSLYETLAQQVIMSGPTNFAPLIDKAIEIVTQGSRPEYHILLIVADGQVVSERDTIDAIVRASNYPLSIVMVGVGDGPWEVMEEFDDGLPERKFDNFQFVDFNAVESDARKKGLNPDVCFALAALMEIPDQFNACKKLGLI